MLEEVLKPRSVHGKCVCTFYQKKVKITTHPGFYGRVGLWVSNRWGSEVNRKGIVWELLHSGRLRRTLCTATAGSLMLTTLKMLLHMKHLEPRSDGQIQEFWEKKLVWSPVSIRTNPPVQPVNVGLHLWANYRLNPKGPGKESWRESSVRWKTPQYQQSKFKKV